MNVWHGILNVLVFFAAVGALAVAVFCWVSFWAWLVDVTNQEWLIVGAFSPVILFLLAVVFAYGASR